jgi:hypothetical protein
MDMKKRLIIITAVVLLVAAVVTVGILWTRDRAEKEAWERKVTTSADGSIVPCAKRSITAGGAAPFCESDKYCVLKVDATSAAGEETKYCTAASADQQDQYSCEAMFGKWGNWNGAGQPSCNKAYGDGGSPCKDGAECDAGFCLGQLDDPQVQVASRGVCPRWQFGESGYVIMNGIVDSYRD